MRTSSRKTYAMPKPTSLPIDHEGATVTNTTQHQPARVPPPNKHQLALMIWLCVFPTLTVINLALGDWLRPMSPVLRTFVLATIAVPIVSDGLMPPLHRFRQRVLTPRRE